MFSEPTKSSILVIVLLQAKAAFHSRITQVTCKFRSDHTYEDESINSPWLTALLWTLQSFVLFHVSRHAYVFQVYFTEFVSSVFLYLAIAYEFFRPTFRYSSTEPVSSSFPSLAIATKISGH